MTPGGQLKEEHDGILLMLKILDKVSAKMKKQGKADLTHLEQIVAFFKIFADKCHHGKEEDLLFPEMVEAGIPKDRGPIGVMLAEHVQGRAYVRAMGEAVEALKGGDRKAQEKFIENARNYIALLTQHIDKENNILFPMGDRVLDRKTQEELLEKFEVMEREKIGVGTHEKFHKLLGDLKQIYLGS
jgi:hemerythrin-like domain-containing protein